MDPELTTRAKVFVDSKAAALAESGDIVLGIREGRFAESHLLAELGEVVRNPALGAWSPDRVTVFKSLGLAVEDVASAHLAYRLAKERGMGWSLSNYDCVVVGAGVFGAWTAYLLRRAGHWVALVDAYGPGNARSSSGGESRIIRMSYGPDEMYTRWAMRSLALWHEFFAEANEPGLFHRTGVLWTARAGEPRAAANLRALENAGVAFEGLTQEEVTRRFPQLRFSWPVTAVFEPDSGVLLARRCVAAVVRAAVRLGADYYPAISERPAGRGRVTGLTIGPGQDLGAGAVIYCCGAWLPKVFPKLLGSLIRTTRQEIFFLGTPPGSRAFAPPHMPVWLDYSDPRGGYSIPDLESRGFKLAFDQHGPEADPDTQERVVGTASLQLARQFVRERFPDLSDAPFVETRVCQYENTSSGDFLIDRHPEFENVWIAGGGSGHGFKHGPAVGEYVTRLLGNTIEPEPRFALAAKSQAPARSVY